MKTRTCGTGGTPGRTIHAGLEPIIPQIEYRELERCGHHPWLEKWAREEFFQLLHGWLARALAGTAGPGEACCPAKDRRIGGRPDLLDAGIFVLVSGAGWLGGFLVRAASSREAAA